MIQNPEETITIWQEMKTAPTNTRVLCGRWVVTPIGKMRWQVDDGIPFRTMLWGIIRVSNNYGREYTHWKYLPSPPVVPPDIIDSDDFILPSLIPGTRSYK